VQDGDVYDLCGCERQTIGCNCYGRIDSDDDVVYTGSPFITFLFCCYESIGVLDDGTGFPVPDDGETDEEYCHRFAEWQNEQPGWGYDCLDCSDVVQPFEPYECPTP
jgi:hypothetical protein